MDDSMAGETDVTMAATRADTRVAKMAGKMARMKAEMTVEMKVEMTVETMAEMMAGEMDAMTAAMTDVPWVGSSAWSKAARWADSMVGDSDTWMAVSLVDPSVGMWGECSAVN